MNAINERIAALVRESGKTKTEWANRLNVSPQFISSLCNGKKKPSARTISDICEKFGVNETWLRDGDGPMFVAQEPGPLDSLLRELLDGETVTDDDRVLMKNFLELPDEFRDRVIQFVRDCAAELSAPDSADPPSGAELAAELEETKRRLAAAEARADRAEAEAKARTEELLSVYREDEAEEGKQGLAPVRRERSSSPSR